MRLKNEVGLVVCLLMTIICTIRSLKMKIKNFCANVIMMGILFAMYPYRTLFVELERITMVFYTSYVPVTIQKF